MTAYIPLTNTEFAIIDLEDFDKIAKWKWYKDKKGYAVNYKGQKMHHFIAPKEDGLQIDHINRVKADNRQNNLRYVTVSENARNRRRLKDTVNPFAGVSRHKNKWRAYIHLKTEHGAKNKYLGLFDTPEQAARVRDAAVLAHFGRVAYFNFPEELP